MTALGDFTAGDVLAAADLNAIGTWASFTPSFSNFTLGNGTVDYSRYSRINDVVHVELLVTLGSTSSMSTLPTFTVPVSTSKTQLTVGVGRARVGGSFYWTYPYMISNECGMYLVGASSTYGTRQTIGASTPTSWGSSDDFQLSFTYSVA